MSRVAVEHNNTVEFECPASIIPLLSSLAATHSVQIYLISHSGKLESIQGIQPGPIGLLETAQFRDYSVVTESDYIWVLLDGCYEVILDPEVDEKIKDAHRQALSNGTLFAGFSHDGIQYTIDFTSLEMSETNSPLTRPLEHRPSSWYYAVPETGSIERCEDQHSAMIEEMYRYGGSHITMGGTEYTFMFSTGMSFQIDASTSKKFPIARYPQVTSTPCSPCELKINLQLKGSYESLLMVVSQLNELCQHQYYCHTFSFPFPVDGNLQQIVLHQVANITRRYCVSAQYDLIDNHITVTLKGARNYIEKVASFIYTMLDAELQKYLQKYVAPFTFELQQHIAFLNAKLQEYAASSSTRNESWPNGWKPHRKGADFDTVPVEEGSKEWEHVLECMKQTLPQVTIVALERVQNLPLWQKYALEKKQMQRRNVGEVNEKSLFHGSSHINPYKIASSVRGVDFRYSKGGIWGKGAYFAVNASYSDKTYAHKTQISENKQLLLVQVLTGKSYSYKTEENRSLTRPPDLPGAKAGELYDTVNGETNGSLVYVVYDHDKSYPAYIITYKPN